MAIFDKALERLRNIRADIVAGREAEVLRITLDRLALTKLRIQTSGRDSNNAPFAPYVPPYARERRKAGYQTNYVDFTRTGRMWADVFPVVKKSDLFTTVVEVEGRNQRTKDIIKGAYQKRGDITAPSKEEIEFTRFANKKRILDIFAKYLS